MPRSTTTSADPGVDAFRAALGPYSEGHRRARITVYRFAPFTVRVRIVDPDFAGLDYTERRNRVWPCFSVLSEETLSDLGMLLLLTPAEQARSLRNMDFEAGWNGQGQPTA